jgi:hypothetical protein
MKRVGILAVAFTALFTGGPGVALAGQTSGWTGYLDFGFTGVFGSEWVTGSPSAGWGAAGVYGSGAAAFHLAPDFTVQGDAAAGYWSNYDEAGNRWSFNTDDFAAHASWHPAADVLLGAFASYGGESDDANYYAFGVEAQRWIGDTRLYGQLGFVGNASGEATTNLGYGEAVITRYLTPNFSLSAFAGYDHETGNDGSPWVGEDFNWGGRVEMKSSNSPLTVYFAYQGLYTTGSYIGDVPYYAFTQYASVGLRLPFGADATTLKSLDQSVGLTDMNPWFGQTPR